MSQPTGDQPPGPALSDFAELVIATVGQIPAGHVLTYGDVAELVERGGPRQVGAVLAEYGGAVPWWRVVRADGTPAPAVAERAWQRYRAEGTPVRAGGQRIDLGQARWCP